MSHLWQPFLCLYLKVQGSVAKHLYDHHLHQPSIIVTITNPITITMVIIIDGFCLRLQITACTSVYSLLCRDPSSLTSATSIIYLGWGYCSRYLLFWVNSADGVFAVDSCYFLRNDSGGGLLSITADFSQMLIPRGRMESINCNTVTVV